MLKTILTSSLVIVLLLIFSDKASAFVPEQRPVTINHDIFTVQINRIWTIDRIKQNNPQNGRFFLLDVKVINNNWAAEQKTYDLFDANFATITNNVETVPSAALMGDLKDSSLITNSVYPGTHNRIDGHHPVTLSDETEFTLVYDLAANSYTLEIKFLSPLSNTKKTFELWMNQEPESNNYRFALAGLEGVSNIKLENWEILDENFESIIDLEHVTVENCNGIAPLRVTRSLTSTVTTETIVASGYSVELDINMAAAVPRLVTYAIPIPNPILKSLINTFARSSGRLFDFDSEEESSTTEEVVEFTISGEIEAPPGTIANYDFIWYRVSQNGKVDLLIGDERFEVLFSIGDRIRDEIRSLPPTPCEDQ